MKVFLVGDFPKDDKTYGGVEGVLKNLAYELNNRSDINLVLISTSLDNGFKLLDDKCRKYQLNFRASFIKARKKFVEIIEYEKPDVIHLQGVVPGILLFKKEYRDIFVVTQHAILSEERLWQVSIQRKILFRIKELIENYYFKKIQNIIFISRYNKNIYFKRFPKNKEIEYELIPNPVNDIFYQTDSTSVVQNSNELYFVGEIKKRKGLHILLRAIDLLKQREINCKAHIIGGFKEIEYEKEIKNLIDSLNLKDNILFCGWKNQLEIIEYSRNIPVFVLPSFQETLPLSIAEAMCQGKIVIATDLCGIPEMINDEISGYLFPSGDFSELANILERVFGNTKQQNSISEKARLTAKKYAAKNIVDKTIDYYKRITIRNSA